MELVLTEMVAAVTLVGFPCSYGGKVVRINHQNPAVRPLPQWILQPQQYQHQQHRWNKHLTAISTGSSLILTRLEITASANTELSTMAAILKKIVVLLGSW